MQAKAKQAAQQAADEGARMAEEAELAAGRAQRAANDAAVKTNATVRTASEDIDDMLAELKKKLGL